MGASNVSGTAVTATGVCCSIYSNPTISDQKTSDGSGQLLLLVQLTGLYPLTTFYVRAYATNSAGTAYGNQITFTTPDLAIGDPFPGRNCCLYSAVVAIRVTLPDGLTDLSQLPEMFSGSYGWGCQGTDLGGPGSAELTEIGGGYDNTEIIVSNCLTAGIAAKVCWDLATGGYD